MLEDFVIELACNTAANTVSQHTNPKHCVQHSDSARVKTRKHGKKCAFGVFLNFTTLGCLMRFQVTDFTYKMVPGGGIEPPTRGFSILSAPISAALILLTQRLLLSERLSAITHLAQTIVFRHNDK